MDIITEITGKTIETNRLLLRAWKESDIHDFYEYASVAGVGEMAGWPHHESIEDSRKVLQSFLSGKNEFAIVYKASNKVVGSVGLLESWANEDSKYAHLKMKSIGYVLAKEHWGKGLMPEAVSGVIQFCFDEYKLDALTCSHSPANSQSKRVIEKCGFTYVKENEYFDTQLQMAFRGMGYILFKP